MKCVADHAYKVPCQTLAVLCSNFSAFIGDFQDFGQPQRGSTGANIEKRLCKLRKSIGLCDNNSINTYHGGRHIHLHQVVTECYKRSPKIFELYFFNIERGQNFICVFLNNGGK